MRGPTRLSPFMYVAPLLLHFTVPIFRLQNTLSTCMGPESNFYSIFYPDLMHEFELGVWKATFTHLIRILWTSGGTLISKLNFR